jgi:hypothetical protein
MAKYTIPTILKEKHTGLMVMVILASREGAFMGIGLNQTDYTSGNWR